MGTYTAGQDVSPVELQQHSTIDTCAINYDYISVITAFFGLWRGGWDTGGFVVKLEWHDTLDGRLDTRQPGIDLAYDTDEWMDGWTDGRTDGRHTDERTDGEADRRKGGWTDGRTDRGMDEREGGQTGRYGQMDGIDGRTATATATATATGWDKMGRQSLREATGRDGTGWDGMGRTG